MKNINYYYFDIETSKVFDIRTERIIPVTYLTCLLEYDLTNDKEISTTFNRNIKEAMETFEKVNKNDAYNIIYVHNLAYEFRFLLNYCCMNNYHIDNENIVITDNDPIKIKIVELENIEFRCSYRLYAESVEALGQKIGMPKLEYDYSKIRLATDELTAEDYAYNKTDCLIVAKTMAKSIKDGRFKVDNIPLTKQSIVRRNQKEFIKKYYPKNTANKDTLKSLARHKKVQLHDEEFYNMQVEAYTGGLVGCNPSVVNKLVKNVYSIDRTSAYPKVMTYTFPKYVNNNIKETEKFVGKDATMFVNNYIQGKTKAYGFLAKVVITNLKAKDDNMILPISKSDKIELYNGIQSIVTMTDKKSKVMIGKVHYAEKIKLTVNETTMNMIKKFYTFDKVASTVAYASYKKKYLDASLTSYMLSKFATKQVLEKDTVEYGHAKVDLNSIYGSTCMKQIQPKYYVEDDGFKVKKIDYFDELLSEEEKALLFEEHLEEYNKGCIKNFNVFQDGIQITNYAKSDLMDMQDLLKKLGCNILYTDTDSLKFHIPDERNVDKVFRFIDFINNKNEQENKDSKAFKNFGHLIEDNKICKEITGLDYLTKEDWNKINCLGNWKVENYKDSNGNYIPYKYFKTLGNKKYCYTTNIDDNTEIIKTVVAGCNEKLGKVMTEYATENKEQLGYVIDKIFRPGMLLVPEIAGKLVPEIIDPYTVGTIELEDGTVIEDEYSGLLLTDATYTLNIEETACKTVYNISYLDQEFYNSTVKKSIFTGKRIVRYINSDYEKEYSKIKDHIFDI